MFAVSKGWLLGHIVSSKGIYIDPKRIRVINELKPLVDRKGVQSFFGKINFVWRFIPNYASIFKPITKLLRKDQYFEWTSEVQKKIVNIKDTIVSSPVMVSPNFHNHLILYYFPSEDTIATFPTYKNLKGEELPISFMSKELHKLHDYELRYLPLAKQAFALVRGFAYFRSYILNNHVKASVPHPPVKWCLVNLCEKGNGLIGWKSYKNMALRWGHWKLLRDKHFVS